jgi:TrmH family RNA methyltransferase
MTKEVFQNAKQIHFKTFSGPGATIEHLRKEGFQIITTSPYGSSIQSLVKLDDRPIALVIGNETTGVCHKLLAAADKSVLIPMNSGVESLNSYGWRSENFRRA